MTKQFKVYDNYDGDMELLGRGNHNRCLVLAYGRMIDSDDECHILIETSEGEFIEWAEFEEQLELEGLI